MFCEDCSAVILDDLKIGGFVVDENSAPFLMLDEDDKPGRLPIDYIVHDTYPSLPRLTLSSEGGCNLCKLLRETIQSEDVHHALMRSGFDRGSETEVALTMQYIWRAMVCPFGLSLLIVNLCLKKDNVTNVSHWLRFTIESTSDDACQSWLRIDNFEATPINSLDTKSVSWITNKLEACSTVCHPVLETQFVPSRLVRVDCDPPRLVDARKLARPPRSLRYAALSYCWGGPEEARCQLKTKQSTIETMLEGIAESQMTRVLKEAIQATRALNIAYLWIDALCIIQGDAEDWERESKMMGKIYSEAYCTLCALSSRSCLEGFLRVQPAPLSIPFQSKLDPRVRGAYSLRYRGIITTDSRSLESIRYSAMYEDFSTSNWARRGWTYQEYALSKRIVVFSNNAIHFICPSGSETFGHSSDNDEEDGVDFFQVDHLDSSWTSEMAYNEWCNVAADFSRRLLTYKGDRFPAISGLAGYFGNLLGDEYLAGLWKKDLWRGLYWGVGVNVAPSWTALLEQLSGSNAYHAPSWSWASRDRMASFGEASYDHGCFPYGSASYIDDYRPECKAIEGKAAEDGPGRYLSGKVEGGALAIMTRMCPLPGPFCHDFDTWVGDREKPLLNCAVDWLGGSDPPDLWKDISLLLLGSAEGREEWAGNDRVAYGLVLYPVPKTSDTFFRVGVFFSQPSNGEGMALFSKVKEKSIMVV